MTARILSLVLAGSFLVFAALMVGGVLWRPAAVMPPQADDPPGAALSVQTAMGLLEAEVSVGPGLAYLLDIHVTGSEGADGPIPPTVLLEMGDMDMGRQRPPLDILSSEEFHARGSFAMPGRWLFRIGLGDEQQVLAVDARRPDGG